MPEKVIPIGTSQEQLVRGLRELVEMAETGELIAFAGAGVRNVGDEIVVIRGGVWGDWLYSMVGGLESVKIWLLTRDERLAREIERISLEGAD